MFLNGTITKLTAHLNLIALFKKDMSVYFEGKSDNILMNGPCFATDFCFFFLAHTLLLKVLFLKVAFGIQKSNKNYPYSLNPCHQTFPVLSKSSDQCRKLLPLRETLLEHHPLGVCRY